MSSTSETAPRSLGFAHDVVVIGGSAGAIDGLTEIVRRLPGDLGAAVFVAIHVSPHAKSALPRILSRAGPLPAEHPADGGRFERGRIYVAPPDVHLIVDDAVVRLVPGPRENGVRPAIDPLFRSAAVSYGPRVAAVLLSGVLDDGTAGLVAVKRRQGVVILQDPATTPFKGMLDSARANVEVDHCVPVPAIASLLLQLAAGPLAPAAGASVTHDPDVKALLASTHLEPAPLLGTPSVLSCPECGGTLNEQVDDVIRFRCHTGHAYSAESLLAGQTAGIESALWAALRALEDKARLCQKVARRAAERHHERIEARYVEQAETLQQQARLIRQMLTRSDQSDVGD
jgi:two-component system, chemotaxis family, protein-glutamate methylesterase/glutaminase